MELDQPTATLIAAGVAASVSLVSMIATLRWNKRLARLGDFNDERKEARKRMRELAELLHMVETSARRLVALAPQLTPEKLMLEATDTLAIVSNTFRATGSDRVIDYPRAVVDCAARVRTTLTELFLELEMTDERRKDPKVMERLNRLCDGLSSAIEECSKNIRKHVTPEDVA